MQMDLLVVVANCLNGVGALASFYANYLIGFGANKTRVFQFNALCAILMIMGCSMLQSWPTVILNVLWLGVSFLGIKETKSPNGVKWLTVVLYVLIAWAMHAVVTGEVEKAGYLMVALFFVSYFMFSIKAMSKLEYLWWSTVGTVLFIPHLLTFNNYSIMIKEGVSFIIGLVSMYPLYKVMWQDRQRA
jgi:hypothetical protein